ncbi:MAG TPA: hypothetical protein VFI80_04540 [Burkholderiales bacterium]|nr:hypothetical protein [Burkholderiales bacterium]
MHWFITLDGGSHGKEEKREESGEEKEKEESGKKERKKEIVEEAREGKEVRQEKGEVRAKNGEESRDETGNSDGGIDDCNVFDGGDARRGEDRPEPRGRMALSDGLEALERVARTALSPGLRASG